ncbi:MAG TPA: DUF3082 domain-containing protein, partial [Leptolyngbyaceae cyanobacterium]
SNCYGDPVMADTPSPSEQNTPVSAPSPTNMILRCFSGSFVAGTFAVLLYRMMTSIAISFATKPIVSDNQAVINISAAVRTLVVGMVALGAGVFGLAGLGLFLLGGQLTLQHLLKRSESPSEG